MTIGKSSYNQKIWLFAFRQWVEKQTNIAKKQYQGLVKVYEFLLIDDDEITKKSNTEKL